MLNSVSGQDWRSLLLLKGNYTSLPKRDQVDHSSIPGQLVISPNNAAKERWYMDSSNQQGLTNACEIVGNISLLDKVKNREACGADIKLLPRTWGRAVSDGESETCH